MNFLLMIFFKVMHSVRTLCCHSSFIMYTRVASFSFVFPALIFWLPLWLSLIFSIHSLMISAEHCLFFLYSSLFFSVVLDGDCYSFVFAFLCLHRLESRVTWFTLFCASPQLSLHGRVWLHPLMHVSLQPLINNFPS